VFCHHRGIHGPTLKVVVMLRLAPMLLIYMNAEMMHLVLDQLVSLISDMIMKNKNGKMVCI